MASLLNGWKGSHGLEGSAWPDMLSGVLLPGDRQETIAGGGEKKNLRFLTDFLATLQSTVLLKFEKS